MGVNVAKTIEEIIADFDNRTPNEYFLFQIKVSDALKKPKIKAPIGSENQKNQKPHQLNMRETTKLQHGLLILLEVFVSLVINLLHSKDKIRLLS